MEPTAVVTVFLRHRGDVLLLERAGDADTYPGRWAGVSGYVEGDDPLVTARGEVREETGLTGLDVVRAGEPVAVRDEARGIAWRVHPFLADAATRSVTLNEESSRAEWVPATEIRRRETVPGLWTAYDRVRPTPETIAGDREHGAAALSVSALEALRDEAGLTADRGDALGAVESAARSLVESRPAMPVLAARIDRVMAAATTPAEAERGAIEGIERALDADAAAAAVAARRLTGTVLTLSRSGTVTAALRDAEPAVVIAESRPAREGVGIAESLAGAGLDVTLCTDAAVAHVLATRPVDAVLVGADAVLADGRVVNKTGTRAAAIAAHREGVPTLVAAAIDKVTPATDPSLEAGDPTAVYDGDAPVSIENPTFDVTPADCVDAVLTERGRLDGEAVASIAAEHASRRAWRDPAG